MTQKLLKRAALIAVPVVVAVGAGGAIAAAASSDTTVIKACTSKSAIRLAGAKGQCSRGERALAWNRRGPAGATGPAGAAGAAGPAGPAGASAGAASTVGGDPLAGGQAEGFVKIDGIPGESVDREHGGEIDVKAFAFGGKNAPAAGSKVAFSGVRFAKLYDASSPRLFQRLATGQHIPAVTFSFRRPSGDGSLTYKLSDVVVTSYEQGGIKERPLLEQVELDFAKVQISYTPAAGGAPVTAGWDVKANTGA